MTDVNDMANKAIVSVKKYISEIISKTEQRIDSLQKKIDELPKPEPLDYSKVNAVVEDAISSIKLPEDGKDGADGKDADLAEVKSYIDDAISDFKKEQPEPVNGKDGANGKDGDDGKDADINEIKEYIDSLFLKIQPPVDGRDGRDGRDAIEMEIIPLIDEEKSYPRGTYAKHKGGLWHSYQNTSGMRGWECMVEGIESISIDQVSERSFKSVVTYSSGSVLEKSFSIPAILDKGVYSDTGTYEKGDGVTYAGSYWIVQKDSPEGKPGSSDDFRLAVKRGRDGREVVKVEKPKTVKVDL